MDLSEKTMNDVFRNRVKKYGDRLCVEKKMGGIWHSATWNEYYDRSRAFGLGLVSLGLRKGNAVSILSENRLEWLYADMGSLGIGVCVIPVYPTLPSEDIEYIVNNSESKVIVAENKTQLKKILEIADNCPSLEKIIVMEENDAVAHPKVMSFKDLLELGRKNTPKTLLSLKSFHKT
jgi:long-chain acyl-CoA synthetase